MLGTVPSALDILPYLILTNLLHDYQHFTDIKMGTGRVCNFSEVTQ